MHLAEGGEVKRTLILFQPKGANGSGARSA